jgi:hypothetical protein
MTTLEAILASDPTVERLLGGLQLSAEEEDPFLYDPEPGPLDAVDEREWRVDGPHAHAHGGARRSSLVGAPPSQRLLPLASIAHRLREKRAVAASVNEVTRRRHLPMPLWRWRAGAAAGTAPSVPSRGRHILGGLPLFRAGVFAVIFAARSQHAVVQRKLATADAEATQVSAALKVYSEVSRTWLGRALLRPVASCLETGVDLDLAPTPAAWQPAPAANGGAGPAPASSGGAAAADAAATAAARRAAGGLGTGAENAAPPPPSSSSSSSCSSWLGAGWCGRGGPGSSADAASRGKERGRDLTPEVRYQALQLKVRVRAVLDVLDAAFVTVAPPLPRAARVGAAAAAASGASTRAVEAADLVAASAEPGLPVPLATLTLLPTPPPPPLLLFLNTLTTDGVYFPPKYLFATEAMSMARGATGASRWVRPFSLPVGIGRGGGPVTRIGDGGDDELDADEIERRWGGDPFSRAAAAAEVAPDRLGYRRGRRGSAAKAHGGTATAAAAAALAAAKAQPLSPPPRIGRRRPPLSSVAPDAHLIYGPDAYGDFTRVEAVVCFYILMRTVVAGILLDPEHSGAGRVRSHRAARNLQVLASAVYHLVARVFEGILDGQHGLVWPGGAGGEGLGGAAAAAAAAAAGGRGAAAAASAAALSSSGYGRGGAGGPLTPTKKGSSGRGKELVGGGGGPAGSFRGGAGAKGGGADAARLSPLRAFMSVPFQEVFMASPLPGKGSLADQLAQLARQNSGRAPDTLAISMDPDPPRLRGGVDRTNGGPSSPRSPGNMSRNFVVQVGSPPRPAAARGGTGAGGGGGGDEEGEGEDGEAAARNKAFRGDLEQSLAAVLLPAAWFTGDPTVRLLTGGWMDECETRLRVWIARATAAVLLQGGKGSWWKEEVRREREREEARAAAAAAAAALRDKGGASEGKGAE